MESKVTCFCDCLHTITILICSLELCPDRADNAVKMSFQCVELLTLPMYKGTVAIAFTVILTYSQCCTL